MLLAVILRLEIVKYPRSGSSCEPGTPFSCNRNCWPKGNCGTRYSYLLFSYSLDLSSILEHLLLPVHQALKHLSTLMETLPNFQKGVQTPSITHQITFDSPFPLLSSIDDHLDLSYFFPSYVLSVHMYYVRSCDTAHTRRSENSSMTQKMSFHFQVYALTSPSFFHKSKQKLVIRF